LRGLFSLLRRAAGTSRPAALPWFSSLSVAGELLARVLPAIFNAAMSMSFARRS
jgi:hypothetical protein